MPRELEADEKVVVTRIAQLTSALNRLEMRRQNQPVRSQLKPTPLLRALDEEMCSIMGVNPVDIANALKKEFDKMGFKEEGVK